jgi:trehalose 6-phosphate synthase
MPSKEDYNQLSSPTSYQSAVMPPPPITTPVSNGKEQRLIVVSNRLPVTISKDDKGVYHFKMSSGGLVSALSGCKKTMSFTWIGWPGKDVRNVYDVEIRYPWLIEKPSINDY